jgi:lysyl-tRNA synthetase class 2
MAMDSLLGAHCEDTLVVLARDGEQAIRGVLHFVPVYGRSSVSLSFMRRDPRTPNGLTEFLVVRAIELLRERDLDELSLNFAAFARWMHSPEKVHERLLGKLVTLGNPFFQIESLYRFNAKFFPTWKPRYLVYEGAFGLPRTGIAALWAEGQLRKPKLRPNRHDRAAEALT